MSATYGGAYAVLPLAALSKAVQSLEMPSMLCHCQWHNLRWRDHRQRDHRPALVGSTIIGGVVMGGAIIGDPHW